ncbi:MarR family winged helix-turn-helix transcriptional regulator [Radiobacillus kanasensis]|uniref:MarR family winged helix-turn-helix transcriptional regulator n=1 Tax=Radiobacillus kanasensis TaxID=2844358 RepID=UPI001E48EC0D|nr:MarR family winged helix-turn-helix transcriptional regulator [Radiobacillus kanasensis]UFU00380.1 MarR family winged helix-turn-helix transcriptional regulator [Radiobacillus kanasensis]
MEDTRELFQVMTRRFGFLNKNCCSVGGADISVVQSHILYEIDKHQSPSVQTISSILGMDITTFSRQIQSLVKMGLVKKTPLPEDRRIHILSLTTEGTYVAASIDAQMKEYLNEVFSHMSEFEKNAVLQSIKVLNNAMAKSTVCCKPLL